MEYQKIEVPCKRKTWEWFKIIPLGDIHEGNAGCAVDKLKHYVSMIKDSENTFWIGIGDYIDAINYSDPRFDIKTVASKYVGKGDIDKLVQMQIDTIAEIFDPIKDKCLGLHRGNHEEAIRRHYHYDVLYELWKKLKVKQLEDVAITRLAFKNKRANWTSAFDIFSTHGFGGGRKMGGKINKLEDIMLSFESDIYLMGHLHTKSIINKNIPYVDKGGNLMAKKKVGAITGSFLKGYVLGASSYVEKALYPASDMGTVEISVNPMSHDIQIKLI